MYYSYVEIEYVATSFSPARTDLALKLLSDLMELDFKMSNGCILVRCGVRNRFGQVRA